MPSSDPTRPSPRATSDDVPEAPSDPDDAGADDLDPDQPMNPA